MQLRFADVILCASEPQRRALEGELAGLRAGRGDPAVLLVPFGIGADPPEAGRRPLRSAFPAIAEDDPVVLWWGSTGAGWTRRPRFARWPGRRSAGPACVW